MYLEYQEVPEEPPMKKKAIDDDSHLDLMSEQDKRISMIHSMPLGESLVHGPGGETEDIIIHTGYTPPKPQLTVYDEQPIHLPVIVFHFILIVFYSFDIFVD